MDNNAFSGHTILTKILATATVISFVITISLMILYQPTVAQNKKPQNADTLINQKPIQKTGSVVPTTGSKASGNASVKQNSKNGNNKANINSGVNNGVNGDVNTTINYINMNDSGKTENNNNYGVNLGNIGGTHTTNNYGIQPRAISASDFNMIVTAATNKAGLIRFCAFNGVDSEMNAVKSSLITGLRSRGYTNIQEDWNTIMGAAPTSMEIQKNADGGVSFLIPQAR